jgi:hypothetical protein
MTFRRHAWPWLAAFSPASLACACPENQPEQKDKLTDLFKKLR